MASCLFLASAFAQSGGQYTITKGTIDGGGHSNLSDPEATYKLGGTVGQPDAATLTGGVYKLTGGFWLGEVPPAPEPDPTGLDKPRFISFSIPPSPFAVTALRVRFIQLHHVVPPYPYAFQIPMVLFEGLSQYAGPPVQYVESELSGLAFYASQLQCTPYYQDWSTVGLLHVTGEAIVPSSKFDVEILAANCEGNEETCPSFSPPLTVVTTRWGDVEAPFNPPSPTYQPNTTDISSLVNKFRGAVGAPIKARALLAGNSRGKVDITPDLSFTHISACVDAFKGAPYPYKPGKCTGNANKACATNSDCTNAPNPTTGPCILCP